MIYRFTIGGLNYDITLLNETDVKFRISKKSSLLINLVLELDTIIINENQFQNAGGNNFANTVQTSGICVISVIEDSTEISSQTFSYSNIQYDDFKKVYKISPKESEFADFSEKSDIKYNILNTSIDTYTLSSDFYNSAIKGCVLTFDALWYLLNEVFGSQYRIESDFLESNPLYLCQSSNVKKAYTEVTYDEATVFDISLNELLNDLDVLYNLRLHKIGDTIYCKTLTELEDYFKLEGKFDLDTDAFKYFTKQQKEYSFDENTVRSERFESVYDTDYFKDRTIDYDNDGQEIVHRLNGYTDLLGVTSDVSKYASTSFFHIYADSTSVIKKDLPISGFQKYNYTHESNLYEVSDSIGNNKRLTQINFLGEVQSNDLFISNSFSALTGFKSIPEIDVTGYWGDTREYQYSDHPTNLYVGINVFLADASQKTEAKTWEECAVSNIITREWNVQFRVYEGSYALIKINDDWCTYTYSASLTDHQTNYQTLTLSQDTANCVLIYRIVTRPFSHTATTTFDYYKVPCLHLNVFIQVRGSGTTSILNYPLAFIESVPEWKTEGRYMAQGDFEGQTLNFVPVRSKKASTTVFLEKISDLDLSGWVNTQFGIGEIESGDVSIFKKQLVLNCKYNTFRRFSDENLITRFFFDEMTSVRIYDNIIVCTAAIGTDLSTITPEIWVSQYATYTVLNSNYSTENEIIVTSEMGTERKYKVFISIILPRFQYEGTPSLISATPQTSQVWIHSDGVLNYGDSWARYSSSPSGSVIQNNPNLNLITSFTALGMKSLVDLTMYTGLTSVSITVSSLMTQVLLPNNEFTQIIINGTLMSESFIPSLTGVLNGVLLSLENNDFDPNEILVQLDLKGWINGAVNVTGNGVLNASGLAAKSSLELKGWSVAND